MIRAPLADMQETDLRAKPALPDGVLVQPAYRPPVEPTELETQRAIISRLARLGVAAVHIPNEGRRSPIGHLRAVAAGLMPGFPDLLLLGPGARVGFLELKRPSGRIRPAQIERMAWLHRLGHRVALVRDQDYAESVILAWGWRT